MASNAVYWHEFEGIMTFSAPATVTMQAHVDGSGDNFTVQAYSYMSFTPV